MSKDTISLNIEKIIGAGMAMGYLHVYRELDDSEQEIAVDIEFDEQPDEPQTHDYPGCDASADITRITDSKTGKIEYDYECIDNIMEAEDELLPLIASYAYETACEIADFKRQELKESLCE